MPCNGHIADVRQLKEDIAVFLRDQLHLTLSEEKTLITHANDGFVFLGFRFYRGLDREGEWKPKTAVPDAKVESIKEKIKLLTERDRTYLDEAAVLAQVNSVVRGWGRYYQYVPAATTFRDVDHYAFWRMVRWFRHKYRWTTRETLKRRYTDAKGNRRLYAEWKSAKGCQRIMLFTLTRDIVRREYYPRPKENPFLEE